MKILITAWYYPSINGLVISVLNRKKELIKVGNDMDTFRWICSRRPCNEY
ncbi:hypothetical protein [Anaerocolumna sp. MB42-C2]|nr:hypothetical protein [Anaerocolumna sp. MB42-C2]WMJ89245.1 hypothetical protein RBU59_06890 [Anaerocolumna sp. MB42-C2]